MNENERKQRLAHEIEGIILGRLTLKQKFYCMLPILIYLLMFFIMLTLFFRVHPDIWNKFKEAMKGSRSEIEICFGRRC